MAVGMAGLAFGGGTEDRGNVVEALDVGLLREVEVAAVGLALAGEGVFQVLFGLAVLQRHDSLLLGEFVCIGSFVVVRQRPRRSTGHSLTGDQTRVVWGKGG